MAEDGTYGGSHRMLLSLVEAIDRGRYLPLAVCYQRGPLVEGLHAADVETFVWEDLRERERASSLATRAAASLAGVRHRARFLRSHGVDIVHLNNLPTLTIELWLPACKLAGVPLVAHVRGVIPADPGEERLDRLRRRLAHDCDAIICVSNHVLEAAARAGLPRHKMSVIYDGVDPVRWRPWSDAERQLARSALDIGADESVAVLAGNLKPWKGQREALAAACAMPRGLRERTVVLLAGGTAASAVDQEYERSLRAAATLAEASGGPRVRFLGPWNDMPRLYAAADVVLHSSIEPEPLGIVVLEALAMGKVVLASSLGGPAEMITEGAGVLADPRDTMAYAAAMARALTEPSLAASLREGALARAREFTLRAYVDRICAVYDSVIG